jgi:hypothetical protein
MKTNSTLIWLLLVFSVLASASLFLNIRKSSTDLPQTQEPTPSPSTTPIPTNTPEELDYNTYTGRGISFNYPKDATLTESETNETGRTAATQFFHISITLSNGKPIGISLLTNPDNLALSNWVNANQPNDTTPDIVEVGGVTSLLYLKDAMGSLSPILYTKNNDTIFAISSIDNNESFQQLYSTLTFTNE